MHALAVHAVPLGAVAGRDVVLGDDRHQIGAAGDAVDLLGLALGDERAEKVLVGRAICRMGVHGLSLWLA